VKSSAHSVFIFSFILYYTLANFQPAHLNVVTKFEKKDSITYFERLMINAGLKLVVDYDSTIKVKLLYSTTDNFMRKDIYGDFDKAYLLPYVCKRLAAAQKYLKSKHPGYSLIIYDAARPFICQQMLWDYAPLSASQKPLYVSNPKKTSLHNYGAAVDVAIVNENNVQLDFGTPFDFFEEESQPQKEQQLLTQGKLTSKQIENRKLLRDVMKAGGFSSIKTEWWHFNAASRKIAMEKFKLIK